MLNLYSGFLLHGNSYFRNKLKVTSSLDLKGIGLNNGKQSGSAEIEKIRWAGRVGKKRKGELMADGATSTKRVREADGSVESEEEDEISSIETVSATDETELNRMADLLPPATGEKETDSESTVSLNLEFCC